jgi:ribonuclease Y
MTTVLMLILGLAIGAAAGGVGYKVYTSSRVSVARDSAAKILADAEREAETKKKESLLEIRDEVYNMRVEAEQDVKKRASEIERRESKMAEREENLENKMSALERKDQSLTSKEQNSERLRLELENKLKEETSLLEKIGHMTREEARQQLIQRAEEEAKVQAAQIVNKIENEAKEEACRVRPYGRDHGIRRAAAERRG